MKVIHLERNKGESARSIERIFLNVRSKLKSKIEIESVKIPLNKLSLFGLVFSYLRLRKLDANLIHIVGDIHYAVIFFPFKKKVLTIHDLEFYERSKGIKKIIFALFWFYIPIRMADCITVVSNATLICLKKNFYVDEKKIQVINNPVDEFFKFKSKRDQSQEFKIIQVGTKLNKNIDRLVDALIGLKVELTIVGEISDERLSNYSEKIKIRNLINISQEQLQREYWRADALAFVSIYEGFGLPIIEAQASGCPVLCSKIEPMQSVAGENCAVFVDAFDINSIRSGVVSLIENFFLRNLLVTNGKENSKKYDLTQVADDYYQLYRNSIV